MDRDARPVVAEVQGLDERHGVEEVTFRNVTINGEAVPVQPAGFYTDAELNYMRLPTFTEKLGEKPHQIMVLPGQAPVDLAHESRREGVLPNLAVAPRPQRAIGRFRDATEFFKKSLSDEEGA